MTIGDLEKLINEKPDNISWSEWRDVQVDVLVPPCDEFSCYSPCVIESGFVPDDDEPYFLLLPCEELFEEDEGEEDDENFLLN